MGRCEHAEQESAVSSPSRISWLSDLIRLEIVLWDKVDARLKQEHAVSLAFFEGMHFIGQGEGFHSGREGGLRVGDLARAMRITQGATSKLIERMVRAGLIRREADSDDRRASRLGLTDAGRRTLAEASATYEAELGALLDAALSAEEQQGLHDLVRRLLDAANDMG